MNKHFHNSLRALFLSLAVLLSLPMLAVEVVIDGIRYDLVAESKQATVIENGEYSGEVVIPESVEHEGATYSVTSIGNFAFYQCSGLTSIVVEDGNPVYDSRNNCNAIIETATNTLHSGCKTTIIPNSVTSIGEWAFYECSGLTSVTIPNSVTSIGDYAFSDCSGLTSVSIPNSRTYIGDYAFENCSGLTYIFIPHTVSGIGDSAFSGCYFARENFVTTSWWAADNNYWGAYLCDYETEEGLLVDGTSVVFCRKNVERVIIPNSVDSIGERAFGQCYGLTSVTIPNSVTSIGNWAFECCSGLSSVTIPNSVTRLGIGTFNDCSSLTSIVVEEGNPIYDSRNNCNAIVETASNSLICGCNTSIIPNSVTSIEKYAFWQCDGLTSVTIPNSVTSIGHYAFYHCSALSSVTIPNSMESIGDWAFYCCDGLSSVYISDIEAWCNIDFGRYPSSPLSNAQHLYVNGEEVKDLNIPNSVTRIKDCAFSGCSGFTSVTIPNSVTSIGNYAFYRCSGLTSVTIGKSVRSIGEWAFDYCSELLDVYCYAEKVPSTGSDAFNGSYPENATLHVPAASIDSYKATEPWRRFGKIVGLTLEETGIDELKGENGKVKTAVYDLSGRRVQKAQKGIFIRDGKLVVK